MVSDNCSLFVSINVFKLLPHLSFVIASAMFCFPSIQTISDISLRSYAWRRNIMSIINLFSCVEPSLTRQSYRDFESVYVTRLTDRRRICCTVDLITIALSKPRDIAYSSAANTLRVIRRHLTDAQCMMLALLYLSANKTTKPIWDDKSALFAKEEFVNITTRMGG